MSQAEGSRSEQGIPHRHFPQICWPVSSMLSVHLPRQASLRNPSSLSADTGQTLMHLPQDPSILWRHLSSRQGSS